MIERCVHLDRMKNRDPWIARIAKASEFIETDFESDGTADQFFEYTMPRAYEPFVVHIADEAGDMVQCVREIGAPFDAHYTVQTTDDGIDTLLRIRFADGEWSRIPVGRVSITIGVK